MIRLLLIQLFLFAVNVDNYSQDTNLIVRGNRTTVEYLQQLPWVASVETLSEQADIYLLKIDALDIAAFTTSLNTKFPEVSWEMDGYVTARSVPNDPRFAEQVNNLERTGFLDAWDVTPGGVAPDGTEIVIAVLGRGF